MSNATSRRYSEAEELFSFNLNSSRTHSASTPRNENDTSSESTDADQFPAEQEHILCVVWHNDKLGAAYYNMSDHQLYIFNDMVDTKPQLCTTKSLLREINPKHIVTVGSTSDAFVKLLIDSRTSDDETTVNTNEIRSVPSDMTLLSVKEYTFDACKSALKTNLRLPAIPEDATDAEREVYLHYLIHFESVWCVYALGALLKYLTKYWSQFGADGEELQFLDVNQVSLKDHVFVDHNSYEALQIFKRRSHEAKFKCGVSSSNREGLSVFKLFSSQCMSQVGHFTLRTFLSSPIKNMTELNKRLDFIEFALNVPNKVLIDNMQDDLKKISDLSTVLGRIQNSRATLRDWENLYRTMCNIIHINEMCERHCGSVALFAELNELITPELYGLLMSINNAIDFTNNRRRNRPSIKFGLDAELDAKKLRRQNIGQHVTAAANFMADKLPRYLNECSIIYIPEMGHLIVVKEWEPNCDRHQWDSSGLKFVFEVDGSLHYRNAMCVELDTQLGDLHSDIIAHENRIIERLTDVVVKHNKNIRIPLKIAGTFDCLIAMSKIAEQNDYVRPHLNETNTLEIRDGRHPLVELVSETSFQRNDYYSDANQGRVKVVTGPNGSGKTIYVKQVALIVFMAHVGSYVPASEANIAMITSVHTRVQTSESAPVHLSSFMLDLSQVTQALHTATKNSLVVIDEFGRSTVENEGLGLLVGTLKKFLKDETNCPNILISTHFDDIQRHLPQTPFLEYLKLDHAGEGADFSFLFKVVNGVSSCHALEVAASVGMPPDIIARAREILQCLRDNVPIRPLPELLPQHLRDVDPESRDTCLNVRVPAPED